MDVIKLPGSEIWQSGYELGQILEERFPNQCGYDFATAMSYHPNALIQDKGIVDLHCIQKGMNDSETWVWLVTANEITKTQFDTDYTCKRLYIVTGWCDYTGWDCQSGASVYDINVTLYG